jgi:broad specificity phosphatase PhoE
MMCKFNMRLAGWMLAATFLAGGNVHAQQDTAKAAQPVVAEEIDLIRHGESEDNLDAGKPVVSLSGRIMPSSGKILSGWNAASLTMRGVAQAVKAGETLKAADAAAAVPLSQAVWVYSPQLRTQQTLAGVLTGAGMADAATLAAARPDTRVMERSAGDVTNLTWEQAADVWPEMKKGKAARVFHNAEFGYPNGESLALVYKRSAAALDDYMRQSKRVVIVSHELTIKAMLAHLLQGKITDDAFKVKVNNAGVISLRRSGDHWELVQ